MSATPTPFASSLEDHSDEFARARSLGEPVWFEERRREALAAFLDQGLPTRRDEAWRYTNVGRLAKQQARVALPAPAPGAEALSALAPALEVSRRLVFVDGIFCPERSDALGDDCVSLATLRADGSDILEDVLGDGAATKQKPFAALATAFLDDGLLVRVPANTLLAETIHAVFVSTGGEGLRVSHPRVCVHLADGARATIVEEHVSIDGEDRLVNATIDLRVGANAELDHVLLEREGAATTLVSTLEAEVARDGRLRCHTLTLGAGLVRNEASAVLSDTGADCVLNGLFAAAGSGHVDNHTLVDHAMPNGTSRELYKGILQDRARGVFRGRVIVRPDAQHTDARQSNPNLLLSDGAEVDTRPQLEIYADDVKCSHGSTVGQIDADALFYLRSRGLDEQAARGLLTQGFANEVLEALPDAALRERVRRDVLEQLARPVDTT